LALDPASKQAIQEREEAQSQINFLNSVIVDLQSKNDKMKANIEFLEMGISPEDVADLQRCAFNCCCFFFLEKYNFLFQGQYQAECSRTPTLL
jgi:hypothetical protein